MKNFPMDRYKFYTYKNKNGEIVTLAISTFAGKPVKGVAICAIDDTYDVETGKRLAALRCAEKIATKRYLRSLEKVRDAEEYMHDAQSYLYDMNKYNVDAGVELNRIRGDLDKLMDTL